MFSSNLFLQPKKTIRRSREKEKKKNQKKAGAINYLAGEGER
jgi:rRNA processing protein Gar1